ncbi:MAG: TonB-dependent receptor [Bacteroidota bacterium]
MKKIVYSLFVAILSIYQLNAQTCNLKGQVKDAATGELLFGVSVTPKDGTTLITDIDGNFTTTIPYGTYVLKISYFGYQTIERTINAKTPVLVINFDLQSQTLKEVQITSDLAKSRETPIAFSNINIQKLKEDIGSRDIPMILNSTPGVYATTRGGGEGDARVSIRGFNQRFIAVMIDGVPVNDMENGEVYWSNWFGLDAVTRNIQVQRGLGNSKLAIPSVGGTMNIMTKGIDQKSEISLKQEIIGDDMMTKYGRVSFNSLRTTLMFNSGKLKNGWGVTASGSYKQGDGYVYGTNFRGGFYYLKIDKKFKNQSISLSVFGAPQWHGTRANRQIIQAYDKNYAAKLFKGTSLEYQEMIAMNQALNAVRQNPGDSTIRANYNATYSSLNVIDSSNFFNLFTSADFIDTTGAQNYGIRYNDVWAQVERYNDENDTSKGRQDPMIYNFSRNTYHKPQITLRHTWSPSEKFFLVTTLYTSIGIGGGNSTEGNNIPFNYADGNLNGQIVYDANVNRASGISKTIVKQSFNNHYWVGGLSTFEYKPYKFLTFSGGIDGRYYKGIHYRQIYDLFGGDFYQESKISNYNRSLKDSLYVGDKIGYNYNGYVSYAGAFALAEYKLKDFSAFINLSGGATIYNKTDFFARKDLYINNTRIINAVGFGDTLVTNGTDYLIAYSGRKIRTNGDTTFVRYSGSNEQYILGANNIYTSESAEAKTFKLGNVVIPSFTIKAGFNYNINEKNNVFINAGFINKAPPYNAVIPNNRNAVSVNYKNEKIIAFEIGYGLKTKIVTAAVNAYVTDWKNKPTTRTISDPSNPDLSESVYIPGLNATHIGAELELGIKPHKKLNIDFLCSYGDWRWSSGNNFTYTFASGYTDTISFDATGVHVGDAAQFQIGGSVRYEPIKGLYFKPQIVYFGKNFADFSPEGLNGNNIGRDSWRLPNYYTLDFSMGYSITIQKNYAITLRANLFNITNNSFISDASNNTTAQYRDFDAKSATVYFGQGFRWNIGVEFSLMNFLEKKVTKPE